MIQDCFRLQGICQLAELDILVQFKNIFEFKRIYDCRPVVPGGARGAMAPQIFADQLTQSQPRGSRLFTPNDTGTSGLSDPPTALINMCILQSYDDLKSLMNFYAPVIFLDRY